MKLTAWRLIAERWLGSAFSGEGARLSGGRWNSKGTPVVYLGGSLALSALELLAHIDHQRALAQHYGIPVKFEEPLAVAIDKRDLPSTFPDPGSTEATRRIGDAWLRTEASPLLRVPSAVVPQEFNYLFNPAHPQAAEVKIGKAVPFVFDRRIVDGEAPA